MYSPKNELHTVVIGAGQAGLAAGYYLQRAGVPFVILDANPTVGDNWRKRWKGLYLFSPQQYNHLPGMPPPGDPLYLPSRLEVADYLADYAKRFDLPLVTGSHVKRVTCDGDFRVVSGGQTYTTRNVIVATGAYRTPKIPAAVADTFPPDTPQYHSSEIRDLEALLDKNSAVLVVGAGASGLQLARIALDAGADVTLCGRDVANLPRSFLGKDIYWWLYKSGSMSIRTDRSPGEWLIAKKGEVTVAEDRSYLEKHPRLNRIKSRLRCFRDGALYFCCGNEGTRTLPWPGDKDPVVIWCTGFDNRYDWLPGEATDDAGKPLQCGGKSDTLSGLYFLGLPNMIRPNSSLLGGVGRDAERIIGLLTEGQ